MTISEGMYDWMQTMARRVMEDCDTLSVSLTYTRQTARTIAPTTGAITATTAATTVTGLRLDYGSRGKVRNNATVEDGPVTFLVEKRRLSFVPSRKDRITEGSLIYEVVDFATDGGQLAWVLNCKRVGT